MDFIKKNIKWIAIILILVFLVTGSLFAYNKFYPKGLIAGIIADEIKTMKDQYEQDLAEKDKEISAIASRVKKSEAQVAVLNNKIKTLEGKIIDVQKPITSQETKDRLRVLGYPPIR